ncbi:MAG: CRISPR system precrRNA processing endoribonuclease RAMP protein Cas6 [Gaiellales bacterium]|nr:MAG: CRISPR system precrRNA processing endoribonuclease RAMP protein Cas6 [Gaiellales bacterium]
MLRSFSLARFRFVLEPEDRLALHPRNPGNTLRGAFGSTFKRLVCPAPSECRDTCRLKATCPYGQIFEPSPPPGTDRLSLNQDIPRPFVLRPPHGHESTAGRDQTLHFGLTLIGKAVEYFAYFLVTFRELGAQGIGIGRGRYRITCVKALNDCEEEIAEVYSGSDNMVRPSFYRLTYKDCCRLAAERFPNRNCITIRFLTPTHLKADGKIVTRPDFHHVIKRLRDRINALAHFYCQDALDLDHKAFGQRAESVCTVNSHVRWEDRDRRSWKTGLSHDMGGLVGEVTYEGNLQEFIPLLILGQYTHVGKYAVWGNGLYEVVTGE